MYDGLHGRQHGSAAYRERLEFKIGGICDSDALSKDAASHRIATPWPVLLRRPRLNRSMNGLSMIRRTLRCYSSRTLNTNMLVTVNWINGKGGEGGRTG